MCYIIPAPTCIRCNNGRLYALESLGSQGLGSTPRNPATFEDLKGPARVLGWLPWYSWKRGSRGTTSKMPWQASPGTRSIPAPREAGLAPSSPRSTIGPGPHQRLRCIEDVHGPEKQHERHLPRMTRKPFRNVQDRRESSTRLDVMSPRHCRTGLHVGEISDLLA
jgi:hypothetical protein